MVERPKGLAGRLIRVAGLLFVSASVYFLVSSFVRGIRETGGLGNLLHLKPGYFLLSFAVLEVHLFSCGWAWQKVVRLTGRRLSIWKCYAIHFLAQIGKYIPGKVWAAIGKYALSCDSGLTRTQTGHALALETVFIVFGSLLTAMPLVPGAARAAGMNGSGAVWLAVGAGILVLAALHPSVLALMVRVLSRLTRRNIDTHRPTFGQTLRTVPVYGLVFATLGTGFWLLTLSLGMDIPVIPGIFLYPTALGIGYLVLLAPGGLGIRELVLVWLIRMAAPDSEPGAAEFAAMAGRLWITVGEALAFLLSLPLYGSGAGRILRLVYRRESTGS
jgi:hypothetical protein